MLLGEWLSPPYSPFWRIKCEVTVRYNTSMQFFQLSGSVCYRECKISLDFGYHSFYEALGCDEVASVISDPVSRHRKESEETLGDLLASRVIALCGCTENGCKSLSSSEMARTSYAGQPCIDLRPKSCLLCIHKSLDYFHYFWKPFDNIG